MYRTVNEPEWSLVGCAGFGLGTAGYPEMCASGRLRMELKLSDPGINNGYLDAVESSAAYCCGPVSCF